MLNKIWFALLLVGILYGFGKGAWNSLHGPPPPQAPEAAENVEAAENFDAAKNVDAARNVEAGDKTDAKAKEAGAGVPDFRDLNQIGKDLNAAALDAAKLSVEICIGLIGIMALWLGLLQIASDSGLVDALAKLMSPLMRWLFPGVPAGHPAHGAMLMNISANMLGLDNAATPLGLKAMEELQSLNSEHDTATDSMAMFLAINTSNVTLIPFTIIGYRAIAGSENPVQPFIGIVVVTTVSTIVAVSAARLLSRLPRYASTRPDAPAAGGDLA